MGNHVFECYKQNHIIWDISGEPIPHVGETEKIYCPTCERDVTGEYLGQAKGRIESGQKTEEITLISVSETKNRNDSEAAYCMKCDGKCDFSHG